MLLIHCMYINWPNHNYNFDLQGGTEARARIVRHVVEGGGKYKRYDVHYVYLFYSPNNTSNIYSK